MKAAPAIFRREEEDLVEYMLSNISTSVVKRGLQFLCTEVLAGRTFYNRQRLIELLQALKTTTDVKLRGWLYNAIGVLRATEFQDFITYQLVFNETDGENRTWAVAALFVICPEPIVLKIINDSRANFHGSELELAAQLYYDGAALDFPSDTKLLGRLENSPLFSKWYALLFGYGRTDRRSLQIPFPDRQFVAALNTHHDPEVIEYSLWALHRAAHTHFSHASIQTHTLVSLPPNVRRWGYRLVAKDRRSYAANKEFLVASIRSERDVVAREGLALGLAAHYDKTIVPEIVDWYARETGELIRLALIAHFVQYSGRNRDYEDLITRHLENESAHLLGQKLIQSAATQLPEAHRVRRLLRSIQSRRSAIEQLAITFGGSSMDETKRTVTNIAVGGGVINVSGINMGEIERATFGAISTLKHFDGLKGALSKYAEELGGYEELSDNDRAIAHSAVQDVVNAASAEPKEADKSIVLRRSISCLRGLMAAMPTATKFIEDTSRLIDSVNTTFGL